MEKYQPTTAGQTIATDSGLADLTAKIYDTDYDSPLLSQLTTDRPSHHSDPEAIKAAAIKKAHATYVSSAERQTFVRGLGIDADLDTWRVIGETPKDILFPSPDVKVFTQASSTDSLVVSGVVGLQMTNFRNQCRLLAKSRYAEFGFDNFAQSCAFVGAYVVGQLVQKDYERFMARRPEFSYVAQNIIHSIAIYGDMHGDFGMSEQVSPTDNVISPTNAMTDYGPVVKNTVSAYHSVEPDIAESMIVHMYKRYGHTAARQFVSNLNAVGNLCMNALDSGYPSTGGPFAIPFGDFGDGRINLWHLEGVLGDDLLEDLVKDKTLHSTPFKPQSSIRFEILSLQSGLRFQNKDDNTEKTFDHIDIPDNKLVDLFGTLLSQTQAGLGRTSVFQLIKLVSKAKELLK